MSFRWTVVVFLTLIIFLPVAAGGQVCVDPPTGMTAWWPGDGNAADIFGTWGGTLVGNTTYAAGKVGEAFSFDGNGDYVEISNSSYGDFGADPFTVDFWMYSNNVGVRAYVIGKSNPNVGGAGWDIRLDAQTIIVGGVDGWGDDITSDASATAGTWHHIAVTSTTTDVVLYIDGVDKGSSARSTINTEPDPLRFGDNPKYGHPGLNGLIDEVEFFDRALSEDEVQSIYNAGAAGKCRPCTALPDGAVAWWRAEDDALDEVGDNDGTPTGDATWEDGKVGRAFSFDGNGDHVEISDSSFGDFGADPFTVYFWMYSNAIGVREYVVGKSTPNVGDAGWDIRLDAETIKVYGVDGWGAADITSDASATAGEWHHIALTSTTTDVVLYIDGVVKGSSDRSTIITEPSPLRFGDNPNYGDPGLNGLIDEVAIFDRALTVDEIEAMFNAGAAGVCASCTEAPSDLVSWWQGEDDATDAAGINNGTAVNNATFAPGFVGLAISVPSNSDYVEVPHDASLSFGSTDPMSIDLWVKRTSTAAIQHIFGKRNGCSDTEYNYQLVWIESSDQLCFGYGVQLCTTADKLPLNRWVHVAATFDGAVGTLYVNGQPEATAPMTLGADTNDPPLRFGTSGTCHQFTQSFGGLLDEIELHDRGLSRDEVAAIYNAGAYGKCALDVVPDPFSFTDLTGVLLSSTESSNPVAVTGIDISVPILIDSCTGGACQYSINGDSWTDVTGSVAEGDEVEVRQTSAATYGTTTDLTLDIGGVTDAFSVTTLRQFTLTISLAGTANGTVTSSPTGIDCGFDCDELFDEGAVVTLTTTPDAGSAFVGWSGAADCADGEVTISGDLWCTATFGPADIFEDGFESGNTLAWSATVQ